MLILSLDTATDIATACVWRDGLALAESATRARSVAAQRVLADIDRLMDEAGVTPADLDLVVAGTGPGTFTGLRIGLAAARALGFALGIPVKGVSTLDALRAAEGVDVACVDARRGEVFAAGAGLAVQAIAPEALAEALAPGTVCAGDGAIRYRDRAAGPRDPGRRLAASRPLGPASRRPRRHGGAARAALHPRSRRRPRARSEGRLMMTAVKLRRLRTSDLDRIEELERESYPTPWSRSMFAGELAKPSGICLGAFQGADMLGYLIVARYVDAWHIMNVAVDPIWRGRGVARTLLERLFEVTGEDPDRGFTLEVRVTNAVAIHLYESLGFVTTGVRRGYYTDNREDALIMWKDAEPPV